MSIDKIGNMENMINVSHTQVQHKLQKADINDSIEIAEKRPAKKDATRINYPPFFPVGDTQGIYKK